MVAWRSKSCRLAGMLTLTVSFFLVELISGYMTNSMSLVADSFHMLSDVVALCIAFFSVRIAKKKSKKNTFGWARAEVLGALINSVFLFALCFSILIEAIKRLIEIEQVHDPLQILIVGGIGLLVNLLGLALFHGHAHEHHVHPVRMGEEHNLEKLAMEMDLEAGEEIISINNSPELCSEQKDVRFMDSSHDDTQQRQRISATRAGNVSEKTLLHKSGDHGHTHASGGKGGGHGHAHANLNMRAAFLHVLGDALGSVVVIISALVILFTEWSFRDYVDPVMSMILVTIILWTTGPVIKESALVLLQTAPTHIKTEELKVKMVRLFPEISSVHEFHVWQLTGNKIIASAHMRCRSIADYMLLARRIKKFFHNEGIHSTTIQPEFVEQPSIVVPVRHGSAIQSDPTINMKSWVLNAGEGIQLDASKTNQSSEDSLTADANDSEIMPSGNPIAGFREVIDGTANDFHDDEHELQERIGCVLLCPTDDPYECGKDRCCDPRERLQMTVTTTPAAPTGTNNKRSGIFSLFSGSGSNSGPHVVVPATTSTPHAFVNDDSVTVGTTPLTSNEPV